MKKRTKRLTSLLLAAVMTASLVCATGCSGKTEGTTPQLRINEETNYWEVSYDNGATWESFEVKATADPIIPLLQINATTNEWEVSYDEGATWIAMGVKATGEAGMDGKDGVDSKDGVDGKDGINGTNGTNGVDGKDGTDGKDGVDGADGKDGTDGKDGADGADGKDGADGATPYIGADGYWYINGVNTGVHTGVVDKTFKTVAELTEQLGKSGGFNKASCFGTSACFGSVYVRVLAEDYDYYYGAAGIANYLKGVFVEDADGNVSVSSSSGLRKISYTDALTVINFASAFSSYNEYIERNGIEMPEDIAAQKVLAIKYFNTVDYTAEGYNTKTANGSFTFPSMAVAVVALGSLMEQTDTARYDTLIELAYENIDAAFYNSGMYLQPFYQLCAKESWYDISSVEAEVAKETALDASDVLKYYGYGIDLENDYSELWDAFVTSALSDNALTSSEAKAFAYHYAYQLTDGAAYLGVYGSSRDIVDYSVIDAITE